MQIKLNLFSLISQVVARPKGLSPKSGRANVKGSNKLPPRLAKQKEQREKKKDITKDVMPKIELWDNELANNIPSLLAGLDGNGPNGGNSVSASSSAALDDIGGMKLIHLWIFSVC